MPLLVSSGSIQYNYNPQNINNGNYSFCTPNSFVNSSIDWNTSNVSSQIYGDSLYQLLSPNSIYNTVLTFIITIVGTQVCGAQASNLNLSLYNSNVTFYSENIHLNTQMYVIKIIH